MTPIKHSRCRFTGSFVALPTPLRDGRVDLPGLHALVDFHVERGTDGLVVCGTTGEAATLTDTERSSVIESTIARARGRVPVIAGVGTNCTRSTIEHAKAAQVAGVDALLVVTPYYNRPSPAGLVAHYSAVAEAVTAPIVLYNVPSRTGVDMTPAVVAQIASRYDHVVAVKEALASVERAKELVARTPAAVLCGDDGSIADFMGVGAVGWIGVVGNVVPEKAAELVRCAAPGGNTVRAAELVEYLRPLVRAMFLETNPVPVKAALARLLSSVTDEVRLPLAPLEEGTRAELDRTLRSAGLL